MMIDWIGRRFTQLVILLLIPFQFLRPSKLCGMCGDFVTVYACAWCGRSDQPPKCAEEMSVPRVGYDEEDYADLFNTLD